MQPDVNFEVSRAAVALVTAEEGALVVLARPSVLDSGPRRQVGS